MKFLYAHNKRASASSTYQGEGKIDRFSF